MASDNKKDETHMNLKRVFGDVYLATDVCRGDQCRTCNEQPRGRGHHGSTRAFRDGHDGIDWSNVRANAWNN